SASYGAATSVTGTYRVAGLATGQYDVQFQDCSRRGYAAQWYNGKPDRASADPVAVTQGLTTSSIDARLAGGPPPDTPPPTSTSPALTGCPGWPSVCPTSPCPGRARTRTWSGSPMTWPTTTSIPSSPASTST